MKYSGKPLKPAVKRQNILLYLILRPGDFAENLKSQINAHFAGIALKYVLQVLYGSRKKSAKRRFHYHIAAAYSVEDVKKHVNMAQSSSRRNMNSLQKQKKTLLPASVPVPGVSYDG